MDTIKTSMKPKFWWFNEGDIYEKMVQGGLKSINMQITNTLAKFNIAPEKLPSQ